MAVHDANQLAEEPFSGFDEKAFSFFIKLARHNDREWFARHKTLYEQTLQAPMLRLVRDLAQALHDVGLPMQTQQRSPVNRIYRDTRFSPNKSPFHTHLAAVLYRDGSKTNEGVIYLHFNAKEAFVAAGFWQPEKQSLLRWRESIAAAPGSLLRIASTLALDTGDSLTRMPRGFERHAEIEAAPLLRLKSFVARQTIAPAELGSRAVLDSIVAFAQRAAPLLRYGWTLGSGTTRSA